MAGPGWDPRTYNPRPPPDNDGGGVDYPPAMPSSSPSPPLKPRADDQGSVRLRDRTWNTAFGPVGLKTFAQKKYIKWYIAIVLISIGAALLTIFHKQIVNGLRPFANDLQQMKLGWLIPVAILFVISFPPLFGHEIITVLCGLVWGLWKGFGIVALGTLLGELGNFYLFKYACTGRSQKHESSDLNYACMCVIVREGGFWIAFLARLSAIPGHLVTPVFATTGMSLPIFLAATVLSLPKQLAAVYVGTLFETDKSAEPLSSKIVEYVVLGVAVVVTVVAMWYIYKRMAEKRPEVERLWAEKRAARLAEEGVALPTLLDEDHPGSAAPSKRRSFFGRFSRDHPRRDHPHHPDRDEAKFDDEYAAAGMEAKAGLVGHAAAPGYAGLGIDSTSTVDLPFDDPAGRSHYGDPDLGGDTRGAYAPPSEQFPPPPPDPYGGEDTTTTTAAPATIEYVAGPPDRRGEGQRKPQRPARPPPPSFVLAGAGASPTRQNTNPTATATTTTMMDGPSSMVTRQAKRQGPSNGGGGGGGGREPATRESSVPAIPPPPPMSAVSPPEERSVPGARARAVDGGEDAATGMAGRGAAREEGEEFYRRKSTAHSPDAVVAGARARPERDQRTGRTPAPSDLTGTGAAGRGGASEGRPPRFADVDPGA